MSRQQMDRKIFQAIRQKELAEQMMVCNDYASAREHLLRAQQLFPAIENIGSMLTVCEILSAADIRLPGSGIDYYWILRLMPSSNFIDIRCRYEKLVALLQPIRQEFPGTELALKLLQDAFTVLSNHDKRSQFDSRRGTGRERYRSMDVQVLSCFGISNGESVTTAQDSLGYEMDSSNQICDRSSKQTEGPSDGVCTFAANPVNFQDVGGADGEVEAQEFNQFSAINANSPTRIESLKENVSSSEAVLHKRQCQDFYNFDVNRKLHNLKAGQIWAARYEASLHHNYRYAQINLTSEKQTVSVTWLKPIPISLGERRWWDAGLPVACGSFEVNSEMSDEVNWEVISSYKSSWGFGVTEAQLEIYPKMGEIWALYKDWNLDDWSYNSDPMKQCKFVLVEIISDFSKYLGADGACLVKVDGLRSTFQRQTIGGNHVTFHIPPNNLYIFSHRIPAYRFVGGEIDKVVDGMFELDQLALPDDLVQVFGAEKEKMPTTGSFTSLSPTRRFPYLNSYPDDEVLKPSWSPNDFASGQVWAVYSGEELMPRQYAQIDSVISENQVCITILDPLPSHDHEIAWKRNGLPITCGIFKISRTRVNLDMSVFSYLVKCQRSTCDSFYKIYPLKGEIWAMYKSWNNKWKISDYERCQCWIVQILSNLSDQGGITIARLREVKGCLSFFHRQQYDGFNLTHVVSRDYMLSFSHKIPAFRVPGIGKYGIPENSWHLEPNALPFKRCN